MVELSSKHIKSHKKHKKKINNKTKKATTKKQTLREKEPKTRHVHVVGFGSRQDSDKQNLFFKMCHFEYWKYNF